MRRSPLIAIGAGLALLGAAALLWPRDDREADATSPAQPADSRGLPPRRASVAPLLGGFALAGGAIVMVLAVYKTADRL